MRNPSALLWTLVLLISFPVIAADELDQSHRALKIIGDFANSICSVPIKGKSSSTEVSATARAEVSNFVKKLADLKIEGIAKYTVSDYEGMLQKDLATALKDASTCRQKVFLDLKDRIFFKPVTSMDNKEREALSAAIRHCHDGDFNEAVREITALSAKFPISGELRRADEICRRLQSTPVDIDIALLQEPSLYQSGEPLRNYKARGAINIDGTYCGSVNNRLYDQERTCNTMPGDRPFQLWFIEVWKNDTSSDINNLNGETIVQDATCAGVFRVNPMIQKYMILMCIAEDSRIERCTIQPLQSRTAVFNQSNCVFVIAR